jgi:hypothetical protein
MTKLADTLRAAQMQAQAQPLQVAELQLKQQLAQRDPNPQVAA